MKTNSNLSDRLTILQVMELTGYKRATIYSKASLGTFPKPIRVKGIKRIWFLKTEVENYLTSGVL
jgi:predicted DNA-binding transcriptional regulator AlpA